MINRLITTLGGLVLLIAAWVFVPPPHQASAQFVGQATYGGTSGGSANAQTITIANYTGALAGVQLTFVPGNTNTGPTTLNVSGLGAVAVQRPSSVGNVALSGSELLSGELTCVTFNGTVYQLGCNLDMTPIGRTVEFRGSATPRGTLIEDGSCVSRTTYAPLFSVVGTTYGACDGSTTFGVPDSRGTMFAALDNQGANGAANRITAGGSGCTATAVGLCGAQSATLTLGQLPTGISVTITPGGGFPNIPLSSLGTSSIQVTNSATANVAPANNSGSWSSATSLTGTSTNTSGAAHAILNPISLGRRAIKY